MWVIHKAVGEDKLNTFVVKVEVGDRGCEVRLSIQFPTYGFRTKYEPTNGRGKRGVMKLRKR